MAGITSAFTNNNALRNSPTVEDTPIRDGFLSNIEHFLKSLANEQETSATGLGDARQVRRELRLFDDQKTLNAELNQPQFAEAVHKLADARSRCIEIPQSTILCILYCSLLSIRKFTPLDTAFKMTK